MSNGEVDELKSRQEDAKADNLNEYRLPGFEPRSEAIKTQPDVDTTKRRPAEKVTQGAEQKSEGKFVDETAPIDENFRSGMLNRAQLGSLEAICKRMQETVNRQILDIKHYFNKHGKDPVTALADAASDPTKVSFWGEFHAYMASPSNKIFAKALEQARSVEVMTPGGKKSVTAVIMSELPASFQPLFDKYNDSPPGTKFVVPEDKELDLLLGEKAAKYFRNGRGGYLDYFGVYEAAHKKGMPIICYDHPALVDLADIEDPALHMAARSEFLPGGSRCPERENYMKSQLLTAIRNHPSNPIIVVAPNGIEHARKDNKVTYDPVSELLSKDLEFAKTKKEIISFASLWTNEETDFHGLSTIADRLQQPVCISVKEAGVPDLLGNGTVGYASDSKNPFVYSDVDQLIFTARKAVSQLPMKSETLPDTQVTLEAFLKTDITEIEKWQVGRLNYIKPYMKEIENLFASDRASNEELVNMNRIINEAGQLPEDQMKKIFNQLKALVFVGENRLSGDPGYDHEERTLLARTLNTVPKGSCLMVDMPVAVGGVIDEFNRSPKGTKLTEFLKTNQDFQNRMKHIDPKLADSISHALSPMSDQVYEAAHDNNIPIIAFGADINDYNNDGRNILITGIIEPYAERIYQECARRPDATVIVWHNRRTYTEQVELALGSYSRFKALHRNVDRIEFIRPIDDTVTLAPLCKSLKTPVSLDLKDPRLSYLSSSPMRTIPISFSSGWTCADFLQRQRTYGQRCDHLIMIPKKKTN